VPGESKVHVPAHPGAVGWFGSGGTEPLLAPVVWVQLVGCAPAPKCTLCELEPLG
jgi:hypothetical protein